MNELERINDYVDSVDYLTVSPSQLNSWFTCQQKWFYSYPGMLTTSEKNYKMERGSYVHDLFHIYYRLVQAGTPVGSQEALDFLIDRIRADFQNGERDVTMIHDVINIVNHYIMVRSPEIDKGIKILGVEHEVMYDTGIVVRGKKVYLHGIVDLYYQDSSKKKRIRDHKTGTRPGSHTLVKTRTNHQLLAYDVALEADVVEISFIHAEPPKSPTAKTARYEMHAVPTSASRRAFYFNNFKNQILAMYSQAPLLNISTDCSSCSFAPLCNNEMVGSGSDNLIQRLYTKKTPPNLTVKEEPNGLWV